MGERTLQPEVRLAVDSSPFYPMITNKRPMYTTDFPVEFREQMEVICNRKIQSLLCAPVLTLDTNEVVAIACLINKRNGDFNERDVEQIGQCFRYTSSVLTSTLMLQNERFLKNKTQV